MKARANNKYKNTEVILVKEDFNPIKDRTAKSEKPQSGSVIYEKSTKHALSKKLLAKLDKKGLKYTKVSMDFEAIEEAARKDYIKRK